MSVVTSTQDYGRNVLQFFLRMQLIIELDAIHRGAEETYSDRHLTRLKRILFIRNSIEMTTNNPYSWRQEYRIAGQNILREEFQYAKNIPAFTIS
jgi:hypothetical protein